MALFFLTRSILIVFSIAVYSAFARPPQAQNTSECNAPWKAVKDAFKSVGGWFEKQYDIAQSWIDGAIKDVEQNAQELVNSLGRVRGNMNTSMDTSVLMEGAENNFRSTFKNAKKYYNEVVKFEEKLRSDVAVNFKDVQQEWKGGLQRLYNSALGKVRDAVEAVKTDQPSGRPQNGAQ